jgi:hypothetical protein
VSNEFFIEAGELFVIAIHVVAPDAHYLRVRNTRLADHHE